MTRVCEVPGCTHKHAARGYCLTHWYHWRKTATDVRVQAHRRHPDPVDRLWAHIARGSDSDCWLWTGTRNRKGYGVIHWHGRQRPAHRVVLGLSLGRELTADELARHRCDNPPCCNPAHLLPGSASDNMRDAVQRSRARQPDNRGERQGVHRLTEVNVADIRVARASGTPVATLAAMHGVSASTIYKVAQGVRWSHSA